jgi:hypothetical protein
MTAATGDLLWQNYTLLAALDSVGSPIGWTLKYSRKGQYPSECSSTQVGGRLLKGPNYYARYNENGSNLDSVIIPSLRLGYSVTSSTICFLWW